MQISIHLVDTAQREMMDVHVTPASALNNNHIMKILLRVRKKKKIFVNHYSCFFCEQVTWKSCTWANGEPFATTSGTPVTDRWSAGNSASTARPASRTTRISDKPPVNITYNKRDNVVCICEV